MGSYLLALRGVTLKGGPGCPRDLGNRSTHIWSFPCMEKQSPEASGDSKLGHLNFPRENWESSENSLGWEGRIPQWKSGIKIILGIVGNVLMDVNPGKQLREVRMVWSTRKS